MEQQFLKRKAEEAMSEVIQKKTKPLPPRHGQRLFFEANLYWHNQYGRKRGVKVRMLLDCGCTGPILKRDFVQRHHIPWVKRDRPITVQTADGKPMEDAGDKYSEDVILRIGTHQEELTWEISRLEDGIDGYLPISWLPLHNPDVQWNTGKMTWRSDYCKKHCLPLTVRDAAKGFIQIIHESKEWISSYCRAAAAGQVWYNKEGGDVADDQPKYYREWASVFSEEEINKLPKHSPWDHEIMLIDGSTPPYGLIYPLNEKEPAVLRDYINKQMAVGRSDSRSPQLVHPSCLSPRPIVCSAHVWTTEA